jgi:putative heme-binding domain-containing protein
MEGRQPIRSDVVRGPTPILPPIADHHHIEARSVTGGYVYRGGRLPELEGAYIYGDYVTGKIWGLRNDGNQVTWHKELADTPLAIITFGENGSGDLYIVDYAGGLHRLKENPRRGQESQFPHRLSETGLFADVVAGTPAHGVLPYSIIAQPWMEGAVAERFIALPGTSSIKTVRNRMQWEYPAGTVFVKTIRYASGERRTDVSGSLADRKLETQILHYDGEEWRPYTYVWNDEQTDAVLAPPEGGQTMIETPRGRQTWRFHSRAECNTCHTPRAGYTLGFFPQNLLTTTRDDVSDQLALLTELGVFESPIPERDKQPAIVDPSDKRAALDQRARAYLMANCAHCHRRGGGGTAFIEFPIEHTLEKTNSIDKPPTQGTFNIPHARIIAPGDPYRSVLYYRMATVGRGHMPHLGTRQIDDAGLQLIHDWIAQMDLSSEDASAAEITRRAAKDRELVQSLTAHADSVGTNSSVDAADDLLESTTLALRLIHAIDDGRLARRSAGELIGVASKHENPIVRGLFERYLPEDARTKRLGTLVNATEILALSGDPARGRTLFVAGAGVQCRNCHQIKGQGREFGPPLDGVGKRLARTQILESILQPSRRIDAKWVGHTLVTSEGAVLTGMLRQRTEDHIMLRDAQGKDHTIPTTDVEEIVAQQKSLMPELLVQDLTADQLADLLAFLESLTEEQG